MHLRAAVALVVVAPLLGAPLRLGRGSVKITPPAGIPMAGYYSIRLAEGTHNDLYAKAIVLEEGEKKAALVACDLVSLDADIVAAARAQIQEATGIPADSVMVSATHSHTGPLLNRRFLKNVEGAPLKLAQQYRAALPGKITEAVRLAAGALAPARAWTGLGQEDSLSFYRRFLMKDGSVRFNPGKLNPDIVQPMGSIDPDVALVYFDTPEGHPQALYVNFALHLDTVGGMQFSADYPYTLSKLMGKLRGPEMLTLFTIGAAGNINHIDVKSKEPQKGHTEAQRIGTVLSGEVLKTLARLKKEEGESLQWAREVVRLPLPFHDAAEVEKARQVAAQFGQPNPPAFLDMVHAMKVIEVAERKGAPLEAEVQVVSYGSGIAWVGLPGEIFVELGVAIKKASPFGQTIIVELANGNISYVPTRKGFNEGGYEAISARCAAGCGEVLAETAIRLLAGLHRRLQLK
jgi:neutral ceramidase